MPAALPSQFVPKADIEGQFVPRIKSTRFGDGYEQRTPDGINSESESWNVTFTGLSKTNGDTLEAFLRARKGSDPIIWTPPNTVTSGYFIAKEIRRKYSGDGTLFSDITCQFQRTYNT